MLFDLNSIDWELIFHDGLETIILADVVLSLVFLIFLSLYFYQRYKSPIERKSSVGNSFPVSQLAEQYWDYKLPLVFTFVYTLYLFARTLIGINISLVLLILGSYLIF